jgi:hypothetical protein
VEVLLDLDTGMPLVRVSRSDDGILSFWLVGVGADGAIALEPVGEAVLARIRKQGPEALRRHLARAMITAAKCVDGADTQRRRIADLEAQIVELEAQLGSRVAA